MWEKFSNLHLEKTKISSTQNHEMLKITGKKMCFKMITKLILYGFYVCKYKTSEQKIAKRSESN